MILSTTASDLIKDPANTAYVSVASCWEMAIKYKIGKLTLTEPYEIQIPREIQVNNFTLLAITYEHAEKTIALDMHHKDPFDRLLIAQALTENMPFLSNESFLDQYQGLDRRW